MSKALNSHASSLNVSARTLPDLSLGSLNDSGFSFPARQSRVPSASSGISAPSTAPIGTPPVPTTNLPFSRKPPYNGVTPKSKRMVSGLGASALGASFLDDEDADGGVLNTPEVEKRWGAGAAEPVTPTAGKSKTGKLGLGAKVPTLRDQERQIDNLKKENFDLKLKNHFLEERLQQLAPDQIEAALKQNINLKVEVQARGREAKKLKKRQTELERALEQASADRDTLAAELRDLERRLAARSGEGNTSSGGGGYSALQAARAEADMRELEHRNGELQEAVDELQELMREHIDEKARLEDMIGARGGNRSRADGSFAEDGTDARRLRRKLQDTAAQRDELKAGLEELEAALRVHVDEKEELADAIEDLRAQLDDSERRREAEAVVRSESRAAVFEEREAREEVEVAYQQARDRLAAVTIELQTREEELDAKAREVEELHHDSERLEQMLEEEWKGALTESQNALEEVTDLLTQREAELGEFKELTAEYEAREVELKEKYEQAFAHLEQEAEEKDAELAAANTEIQRLGAEMYKLEDEFDRLKEEAEQARLDDQDEKDRLQALVDGLKEKSNNLREELSEVTELYQQCNDDLNSLRKQHGELATHLEGLSDELKAERDAREGLEREFDAADAEHADALRRERRTLEGKESALQSALADLARVQALLSQRESDLRAVENALHIAETANRQAGESHTTARFSLQLELDRLRRDAERLEDELARARADLSEREKGAREREAAVDRLHAENRAMATELAAAQQARINVGEKLDGAQAGVKTAETELEKARARAAELEARLSKDQRALLSAENTYRDQLTERNTLLLTIYQYMDKILGVDKVQKKGAAGETKPYTNFSVFHDNLITRLKQLSQIQLDFDKRVKEAEARYAERLTDMRKQLDGRWKQLDKFEASLKQVAEAKAAWRRKLVSKEGELEAIKATNIDLAAQLSGTRKPGGADPMELRSLTQRAANAERRLLIAQNQLAQAEERLANANTKTAAADSKWEARVKEYETRLKAAEEKVKRERQGAKETNLQLENQIKSLMRQKDIADKRNGQLADMVEQYKHTAGPGTPSNGR